MKISGWALMCVPSVASARGYLSGMLGRALLATGLATALIGWWASAAGAIAFVQAPGSPYATTNPAFVPNSGGFLGGIATGDFTGNGVSDVAVVNATGVPVFSPGESVSVLLGEREEGLRFGPDSPIGIFAGGNFSGNGAVAVGDFTDSGKLDLAVVDTINSTVDILLGDGAGGFTQYGTPVAVAGGTQGGGPTRTIAVGDFTGNGKLDLAILGSSSLTVLLGDGSGGFTPAPGGPISVSGFPSAVVAGDFTGNGSSDLAIASESGHVTILLSRPDGTFYEAPGSPVATGGHPADIAAGDLTGNGKLDLATADGDDVSILLGDGSGRFARAPSSPIAVPPTPGLPPGAEGIPTSIGIGDFNGDGIPDLAVANENGAGSVAILLGDGSGGFTNASGSPYPTTGNPRGLVVGDFNGDGREDVAVANPFLGAVTVLDNLPGTEAPSSEVNPPHSSFPPPPIASGPAQSRRPSIALSLEKGALALRVMAPEAGRAVVDWYALASTATGRATRTASVLVAFGRLRFARAGTKVLHMTLTPGGRRMLKRSHRLKLTVKATFTPVGGRSIVVVRRFVW